jgi:hypothetical protein
LFIKYTNGAKKHPRFEKKTHATQTELNGHYSMCDMCESSWCSDGVERNETSSTLKALKGRDIVEMKATAFNQPLANV